jgi:chromosome transmission fidelity protein 1
MFDDTAEQELQLLETVKIFYCSRTHSQLIQFANEVRRVKLPSLITPDQDTEQETPLTEDIKHLALGSRKNLCINSSVRKLGSTLAINEKCLQLQQSKADSANGCSFLPKPENESLVHDFRDHALAKIRDIEELAELGTKLGVCPYYASRAAVKPSEV